MVVAVAAAVARFTLAPFAAAATDAATLAIAIAIPTVPVVVLPARGVTPPPLLFFFITTPSTTLLLLLLRVSIITITIISAEPRLRRVAGHQAVQMFVEEISRRLLYVQLRAVTPILAVFELVMPARFLHLNRQGPPPDDNKSEHRLEERRSKGGREREREEGKARKGRT